MSSSSLLREYGLLGALDSMANMCGEQLAIITDLVPETPEYDEDDPQEAHEDETDELGLEAKGVTYFELQQNSIFLSNQIFMRLGVRPHDHVLIFGQGSTAAELTAMLACMRLQALFIPCATGILSSNGEISMNSKNQLEKVIRDAKPVSAIVVGENDESPVVRFLATQGIYRYSLISQNGGIVEEDPSAYYSSFQTANNFQDADIVNGDDENQFVSSEMNENANIVEQDGKPPSPLYILYTSGSTGVQKGVIGTQNGLINRLEYQYAKFPYNFSEVAVRRTPLTFVDAMVEIFAPVIAGVPICGYLFDRINQEGVISIQKECGLLGITRVTLIPSQLYQWCSQFLREKASDDSDDVGDNKDSKENDDIPWSSITHVFVSGEECSVSTVLLFQTCFPRASLINMYGTTEITGDVTTSILYDGTSQTLNPIISQTCDKEEIKPVVPIGTCMDGNFLFLLQQNDLENDVQFVSNISNDDGELLVLGEHVSLGYHAPSTALEHRFIVNPFLINDEEDQETINSLAQVLVPYVNILGYGQDTCDDDADEQQRAMMLLARLQQYPFAFRTGDLARYFPYQRSSTSEKTQVGGEWVWMGRKDHVIKHHGQKIVLNVLESKLKQLIFPLLRSYTETNDNQQDNHQIPLIVLPLTQDGEQNMTGGTILVVVILASAIRVDTNVNTVKSLINSSSVLAMHEKPTLILFYEDSDHFPVTSSFKIDRLAVKQKIEAFLSKASVSSIAIDDVCNAVGHTVQEAISKEDVENHLWQIISMLLQLSSDEARQISASFFELGGDSVSAIELLWQLRHKYASAAPSLVLTPEQLHLSIAELASLIFSHYIEKFSNKRKFNRCEDDDKVVPSENHPSKKMKKDSSDVKVYSHKVQTSASEIPQSWSRIINRSHFSTASLTTEQRTAMTHHQLPSLHQQWRYPLLKCIDASPMVMCSSLPRAAGVVVGCHGGDIAWIDAQSGAPLWHVHLQSSSRATDHIESATVMDLKTQTLFVTSFLGNDVHASSAPVNSTEKEDNDLHKGCMWAIDVKTGHLHWRRPVLGECKAPALLLPMISCVLIGDYLGHVYVIDIVTGTVLGEIDDLNGAIYATPQLLSLSREDMKEGNSIINLEVLVCTTRGSCYSINIQRGKDSELDVSVAWQHHLESSCTFATPVIIPDETKPEKDADSVNWQGILLACTDGSLRYLTHVSDTTDTSLSAPLCVAWENEEIGTQGAPFFSSPCYVPPQSENREGFVVLGNHDGVLRVVSLKDGHILATHDLQSVLFASPSVIKLTPFATANGEEAEEERYLVVIATTAGEVCLLSLTHALSVEDDDGTNANWSLALCGKHKLPAEIFSSPVVMTTPETPNCTIAKVWVGCRDDALHALDITLEP